MCLSAFTQAIAPDKSILGEAGTGMISKLQPLRLDAFWQTT